MIKIAFVINYVTNNGPSRVVLDIIHNLDYRHYAVSLITLFSGNESRIVTELQTEGVIVFECKTLSRMKCLLGHTSEFQNLIQREKFDIVHAHGFIPDLLTSRIKGKTKTISTLHNNMFEDYINQYGVMQSWLLTKIHLHALNHINRKVCCSASVYNVMKKILNNISFIRNGIEIRSASKQITRKQLEIPEDASVYVFAGGLVFGKNVRFLISEFVKNHLKGEYLIILGDGPEKNECFSLADDHVKICGFQSDPISFFNISDVYVSASQSEGFSIAILEALSTGLALFLSHIPSHSEILEMSGNVYLGELFELSEDGKGFTNGLLNLRNHFNVINKEKIKEFQQQKFSAKSMAEEYSSLYQMF